MQKNNLKLPFVSVIVPNYNHAQFLKQRIDSVLRQSFQDFEIIILDDCSTDNSREIIEKYRGNPKIEHIGYNIINSGSAFQQWAKGFALASGDYVWIAESDDWADDKFLETLIYKISGRPDVAICFCDSHWIDAFGNIGEDLSLYKTEFFRWGDEEIKNYLVKYNTIQNASAALLKKNIAEKYICNISKYKSCGDWRLYIDMLKDSNILFVAEKLNHFRWYHENTSHIAKKNGLWITEGLDIIVNSRATELRYSRKDLAEIINYWWKKPYAFKTFTKIKLQTFSVVYLGIFYLKCTTIKMKSFR